MNRRLHRILVILTSAAILSTGCHPSQPFYFMEDGDLSHYIGKATEIEYPDVHEHSLDEVTQAMRPYTSENPPEASNTWAVCLEDAVKITLQNSKIIRQINPAGRVNGTAPPPVSEALLGTIAESQVNSTYDVALQESSPFGQGIGIEAALAAFDTQFLMSSSWQKNDRIQNTQAGNNVFARNFQQDTNNTSLLLQKRSASGGTFTVGSTTVYDQNTQGFREFPSDWDVSWDFGFVQPLLRDFGTQVNRIAGPRSTRIGSSEFQRVPGSIPSGVMIARINSDQALLDFECAVRDMTSNVETAYWELYFAYRNLTAVISGRDSALQTWRKVHELWRVGHVGGEAEKEAQAREQYFLFKGQVERALWTLYAAENRLRFIMGLSATDGRLIRPCEEPTTARVEFDWHGILCEGLTRSCEIRRHKWEIRRREYELIANKNLLLPQLDAQFRYRYRGTGDDLIDSSGSIVPPGTFPGDAYTALFDGNHQEWQMGVTFSMPLGFRHELAQVRNSELRLAKEKAIFKDKELELSHQLADAYRELDCAYQLMETNNNRRIAAQDQVDAVQVAFEASTVTLDLLLDAQRRLADAESAFYRSVVDYNLAIRNVHLRKGSLLEYNNVYLAEGPWPAKAYYDALGRARERDAGLYMDYGFTRPKVTSRGPYQQNQSRDAPPVENVPTPEGAEELPPPAIGPAAGNPGPTARHVPAARPRRHSWKVGGVNTTGEFFQPISPTAEPVDEPAADQGARHEPLAHQPAVAYSGSSPGRAGLQR